MAGVSGTDGGATRTHEAVPAPAHAVLASDDCEPRTVPRPIVSTAALLFLCLTACVRVEHDKMAGTQYPPTQTVAGENVTLTTIYRDVGFPVVVWQHEAGIAPLAGGCIGEAELDSLESGHRDVPLGPSGVEDCPGCTAYNVYAVTVDHYYGELGPCEPNGTAGMVWTDQRRSFAIFYSTTVSSNGSYHLLAAAHELGHTLGLHHADGNQSFTDATIMNDGSYFAGNNWVFEFTDQSLEHLEDHPLVCKVPGDRSFWEITPEHREWSEGETFDHSSFNVLADEVCP